VLLRSFSEILGEYPPLVQGPGSEFRDHGSGLEIPFSENRDTSSETRDPGSEFRDLGSKTRDSGSEFRIQRATF